MTDAGGSRRATRAFGPPQNAAGQGNVVPADHPFTEPEIGEVEELVESRARLRGAVSVSQIRPAADAGPGHRAHESLGLLQRVGKLSSLGHPALRIGAVPGTAHAPEELPDFRPPTVYLKTDPPTHSHPT